LNARSMISVFRRLDLAGGFRNRWYLPVSMGLGYNYRVNVD
jgi:hypothetical protein